MSFSEIDGIIENISPYINDLSLVCGVDACIIDEQANVLFSSAHNKNCFCANAGNILKVSFSCENVHLYGSYEAERFGGKYIFFCPMGLAHFISPIMIEGNVKASIVAGPVALVEKNEFLEHDIFGNYDILDEDKNKLKKYIKSIPGVSAEKLKAMSEILYITAKHISKDCVGEKDIDINEQQSKISDIIHSIKKKVDNENSSYPILKEKELLSAIKDGDKNESQRLLNEIMGYVFFSSGGDFKIVKARVLELVVLLSRAALEGGADIEQIFGLNYNYINQINLFTKIDELAFWLSKIMNRFTDYVFNLAQIKRSDILFKATSFIKSNYMKKITLDDVASYVYLSPSYFSKVFKDDIGFNFNEYLNKTRIDNSKILLLDPAVSIVDIASMVGYEDQSYFSKVFKKYTGITPKKFRECRGNI